MVTYMQQHKVNFIGIEVSHRDELPCNDEGFFRTLAIMRDPVDRIVSWINLVKGKEKRIQDFMDRKEPHPPHYYFGEYPYVNCFIIRMLLGQERYVDPRPVDENDFRRAMERIDQFDAFVPLKYLGHPNLLSLLNRTIPEYHDALMSKQKIKLFGVNPEKWFRTNTEICGATEERELVRLQTLRLRSQEAGYQCYKRDSVIS